MHNNHKYYIKKETKGQVLCIVLLIIAVAIGLAWSALEARNDPPAWEPTETYPMANTNISWNQTFHPGAWE